MWSWTDPIREAAQAFLNRILPPYIENFDSDRLNFGVKTGQLVLKSLRLKKTALNRFRLPVNVLEGHIGRLTLSIPWTSLRSRPVELFIEDIYLLISPSMFDPEDAELRAQTAKAEKLKFSEMFRMRGSTERSSVQGLVASFLTKIMNSLQITVKNIHIRYEDDMSRPCHTFAVGVTLLKFTVKSVDGDWVPSFVQDKAGSIRKLSRLESLALYFDTDSSILTGLPVERAVEKFASLISSGNHVSDHQFILKPVTGEARITINRKMNDKLPNHDVQLLCGEIEFSLDDQQYRDVISLVDMYHVHLRRCQYCKYAPDQESFAENRPRALLQFAGRSIVGEIHERNRKCTWSYINETCTNRRSYMALFKKRLCNQLNPEDLRALYSLERKLLYEDIQLYRFLTRRQMRQDIKSGRLHKEAVDIGASSGRRWSLGWLMGYYSPGDFNSSLIGNIWGMTDEQRRELYEAVDYNEEANVNETGTGSPNALKLRVATGLGRSVFAIKKHPHGTQAIDIIVLELGNLKADVIRRSDSVVVGFTLGNIRMFDGTTKGLYPQVLHVRDRYPHQLQRDNKGAAGSEAHSARDQDPFFLFRLKNKSLGGSADTELTVRLQHTEVIYHKEYIEEIYKFFCPPESQLESLKTLLEITSTTLARFLREIRRELYCGLDTQEKLNLKMDLQAPIIIIPEDVTTENTNYLVLDAGHMIIENDPAAKDGPESLMYDRFSLKFKSAQVLLGSGLNSCLEALESSNSNSSLHIVERADIELLLQSTALLNCVNFPSDIRSLCFQVSGKLHTLRVNISDTRYKAIIGFKDAMIPMFGDLRATEWVQTASRSQMSRLAGSLLSGLFGSDFRSGINVEDVSDTEECPEKAYVGDVKESTIEGYRPQQFFVLDIQVDTLQAVLSTSNGRDTEQRVGDLRVEHFRLAGAVEALKLDVNVTMQSLAMSLTQSSDESTPLSLSLDRSVLEKKLMTVKFTRVHKAHPEFISSYEGLGRHIKIILSAAIIRAAPEPVISLYDFITTNFVPETSTISPSFPPNRVGEPESAQGGVRESGCLRNTRLAVDLDNVQVLLIDDSSLLAALAFSTANVFVATRGNILHVSVTLGKLLVTDEPNIETRPLSPRQILSIEGNVPVIFSYQTFDVDNKNSFQGVNPVIKLKSGDSRVTFLEGPLQDIYNFINKSAGGRFPRVLSEIITALGMVLRTLVARKGTS